MPFAIFPIVEAVAGATSMASAQQKMDDCGFTEEGEWTYLAKLFGSNAVPGESASVIQQAIKKAEKEGTITSKNRWQLIEYLCADYLSGR